MGMADERQTEAFGCGTERIRRLFCVVIARIDKERRRAAFRKSARHAAFATALFTGFAFAARETVREMTSSGFTAYLSLFVSDARALLRHWQSALLALAETMPTVSALAALLFAGAFLYAVRRTRRAGTFAPVVRA